ncbi:RHS repeat domain-containing protein [Actinoplanes sp. HUAS TT8]|uniref:RHS repeat domain-containing protein n=1 Tax=Actinoplanes sp. HUAS TT8 TaxID=3447453 RepID=UPI003F528D25
MHSSRLLRVLLAGVLAGGSSLAVNPGTAHADPAKPLTAQEYRPVPIARQSTSTTRPAADAAARASGIKRPAPAWPAATTADVTLAAGSGKTRAGTLPVLVGGARSGLSRARVRTLSGTDAARAGLDGLVLKVSAPDAVKPADLDVTVEYGRFASAYGADWASRLRLVALPEGGAPVELPTVNDPKSGTVTAEVAAVTAAGTLVAATSGPSGGAGTFTATDLSPSATWGQSGSSGDFTWSYPLVAPPSAAGLDPDVAISYSAQSVDGRNAASNNQPGPVGEGFKITSQAYVERRYKTCSEDMGGTGANNTVKTGDKCWGTDNAVLTLSGHSGELLKGADGKWHLTGEDGSKVERLTTPAYANGDNDNEYWKVTTADGTQYWFGRHQLPGWSTGKPVTNSVWTAPVFGNNTGEPCHQSTFAASSCYQAWRWNLDYVVDVNGNTMSYWYTKETGKYAKNLVAKTPVDYTRGGYLNRIDYGTDNRDGTEYTSTTPFTSAPQQIEFTPKERCLSNCTTKDATTWPDTPWDLDCTTGSTLTNCLQGAPTFWTEKRLVKVTTKVSGVPVDSWDLDQSFPDPGDGTRAGLWLKGITYTGLVGGTTAAVAYPSVTFEGIQMPNRVDASGADWALAMNWWRVNSIRNETGGQIFVDYSPKECVAGSKIPAVLDANSLRCYPVKWQPPGETKDVTDYYHKYVLTDIQEIDHAGGSKKKVTHYDYLNPDNLPLWHHEDADGLTPEAEQTWADWRGYPTVVATEGTGSEQSKTETLYYRGMHGDLKADGTKRTVNVTDRDGGSAVDYEAFAGQPREEITWNGAAIVEASVTDLWQSEPTATRTIGKSTVESRFTGEAVVRNRTALDGGGWQRSQVVSTHDQYGMVTQVADLGDEATGTDDQCEVTEFARNITGENWLLTPVKRTNAWAGPCDTPPTTSEQVISDTRYQLDGGATLTKGQVTAVETIAGFSGGTRSYHTDSTTKYDSLGRVTDVTDVTGANKHTDYTPVGGGPVTRTVETNALNWTTTTDYDGIRHLPVKVTDTNGRSTEVVYDAAGRTAKVWNPSRSRASFPDSPSSSFDYQLIKADGITVKDASVVTSTALDANGKNRVGYTLYDGFVRERQTQSVAYGGETPTDKIVTDTFYDSAGRTWKENADHVMPGLPTGKIADGLSLDADIWRQTVTSYDGAGREIDVAELSKGAVKWRTTTTYHGDHTDVTPPQGETPTSTWTDARDRTVAVRELHDGTYDETRTTYDPVGHVSTIADASGNTWKYTYDIRGRQTRVADPDKGTADLKFNDKDQTESVTDAEGRTIAYTYDVLGRKTSTRDGSTTGTVRAAWTYDTPAKGLTGSSSRYVTTGGVTSEYKSTLLTVDAEYRAKMSRVSIPGAEGALAGDYTTSYTYRVDGSPATVTLPAVGGLTAETLTYEYDSTYGRPLALKTNYDGATYYVNQATYTNLFEPSTITRSTEATGAAFVSSARYYDESTGRVKRRAVTRSVGSAYLANTSIGYDAAGNVTMLDDNATSGRDTQCFQYDGLKRLREAWTPASSDCSAPASASALGGPAPYWQSWDFGTASDPVGRVGNRLKQVDHGSTGDVTTSYTYAGAGQARPHAVTSTTKAGATTNYSYDKTGNLASRTGSADQQNLTWDAEGHLATLTDKTGTAGYVYDADGNRLVTRDPTGTTLEFGTTQLKLSGGVKSATRYYSFNDEVIGQRTGGGLCWLASDGQGTSLLAVKADAQQTLTQRRQTPYGESRGPAAAWVNSRGFLGGQADPSGLTHLGAREYDPGLGKFISVDPLQDVADPQQWNAYAYANNTPVTMSDSSGTRPECGSGSGWDTCDNSAKRAHRKPGDPPDYKDNHSKARHRQQVQIRRTPVRHGPTRKDLRPTAKPKRNYNFPFQKPRPKPPPPPPPTPAWTKFKDVLRFTSNLPSTAIGWGYGEATGADCGWSKHLIVLCTSGEHARSGGMTIGNVTTTSRSRQEALADNDWLEHERRHSTQYSWYVGNPGGYFAAYGLASGYSALRYKISGPPKDAQGGICDNPAACYNWFESDADLHKGGYYD